MNHRMSADDLVVPCLYRAGLQSRLKACSQYGLDGDVRYNAKESHVTIVSNAEDRKSTSQSFICQTVILLCVRKLNTQVIRAHGGGP